MKSNLSHTHMAICDLHRREAPRECICNQKIHVPAIKKEKKLVSGQKVAEKRDKKTTRREYHAKRQRQCET